jgi:hypothetical protein
MKLDVRKYAGELIGADGILEMQKEKEKALPLYHKATVLQSCATV